MTTYPTAAQKNNITRRNIFFSQIKAAPRVLSCTYPGPQAFKTVAGEEAVTPEKTKIHYPTTKSRVFSVVD